MLNLKKMYIFKCAISTLTIWLLNMDRWYFFYLIAEKYGAIWKCICQYWILHNLRWYGGIKDISK